MVNGLGCGKINEKILGNSGDAYMLRMIPVEDGFSIETRFYLLIIKNNGNIASWQEKRVPYKKYRELVKKD
jgi:hypothetical protein